MAKQLAIEYLAWHCCAVERHEHLACAWRILVDQSGKDVFAGPGLASQKNRDGRLGNASNSLNEVTHRV
jgi:hypothetical protein